MTGSVTFSTGIGGDGSTVTDDDNATTGLRDGGWRTRFVPCFTNQVSIANYVVTQANAASASATAAGSSATSAAAAYDSFDDRYLGAKASDPTLDNDGNALLTGALYWNSTSSVMKVYSGSAWSAAYVPSSDYLALTGGTMTGAITLSSTAINTARSNVTQHATTMNFWGAAVGNVLDGTGAAVTITAIANAPQAGASRDFYPLTGTVLTQGATFDIDGAVTRTSAAGEVWTFVATTTNTYRVFVRKADGTAVVVASAANGLVWLSTVTASNSATVDIENTFNSTYDTYMLVGSGITATVDSQEFLAHMKIGGAYDTGNNYSFHTSVSTSWGAAYVGMAGGSDSSIKIFASNGISSAAHASGDFVMYIHSPSSTAFSKRISFIGGTYDGNPRIINVHGHGRNTGTAALTGIRFFTTTGNILAGKFRLYGIANS